MKEVLSFEGFFFFLIMDRIKYLVLVLSIVHCVEAISQQEDANWMLGGGTERTFADSQALNQCTFSDVINFEERLINFVMDGTNASISDSLGNLVCYTNGVHLFNGNHELIENGGNFQDENEYPNGYKFLQGALILPVPNSEDSYLYLLTDRFRYVANHGFRVSATKPLTYSVIDMRQNSGAGRVIEKKVTLNTDTLAPGQLTATRHANGRDWWILTSKYETNKYYKYMLDPKGINLAGTQEVGDTAKTSLGQSVFSPDGKWYARYNWYGITQINDRKGVDIYQFDRCTGELSDHLHEDLPGIGAPGGIAFSENSRFLYAAGWDTIYQYDMYAADILASRTIVAVYDGFLGSFGLPLRFFSMQLAPNGKIYINIPNINSQYFHSIENPNEKGIACDVKQHSTRFPFFNYFSIPNIPYFRLGKLEGSSCDTIRVSSTSEEILADKGIKIFPNPIGSSFSLTFQEPVQFSIEIKIFDSLGRVVFERTHSKGTEKLEIKSNTWNSGIYFVKIYRNGYQISSSKIIKQ